MVDLDQLRGGAEAAIRSAPDSAELEELRVRYLGRKSELTGMLRSIGELPPEQRAVVHLKLWEELTFEAIAEALDLPANTAASRYRYGLDKLRERLRPLYEEIK